MEDGIAIKGTYSDFKIVKTRNVAQVIIEIPIEEANDRFIKLFGLPNPQEETWVAVAKLHSERMPEISQEQKNKVTQAVLACKDKDFGTFLRDVKNVNEIDTGSIESISQGLKTFLGISSRKQLLDDTGAVRAFDDLYSDFKRWKNANFNKL